MTLKDLRKSFKISASNAALSISVPFRTYVRYENDEGYGNPLKRQAMSKALTDLFETTETKGLLSLEEIKDKVDGVLSKHKDDVNFCYLFGSYAKGKATESSDVDLLIDTSLGGLEFVGLIEELRNVLHKEIDLIRLSSQGENVSFLAEVMKDGIKIYG
ncbi:MAG: nucleotidyltransferase domain-containing protein [Bacilli bacterium]|nr:nucleotidyltransferase domain-containing protein [Bacilli bacterium]